MTGATRHALQLAAVASFAIAAAGIPVRRVNLVALGLALVTLAEIVP